MPLEPKKCWWSIDELFSAALPDMPSTKRRINERAKDWRRVPDCARKRAGRGGGWEYFWTVLPLQAQRALLSDLVIPEDAKPSRDAAAAWRDYGSLTAKAKKAAELRLRCIDEVDLLYSAGVSKTRAAGEVSSRYGVSSRTIFQWYAMIDGVQVQDRLAFLAPRQQLAIRPSRVAVDPTFYDLIKSDYLRQEEPSFKACYDRAVEIAEAEKLPVAQYHQVLRLYRKTVSKPTEVYLRKGREALHRFFPHQTRDKTAMHALECVQGDYHKFDLWVQWPGEEKPVRPQAVFFSDVYSGKMLVHRLSISANSFTVQLTIGDMVDRYGIPESALLDNGREFAAKVITGTAPTRFRFKIQEDDIPGLLPMLGVKVHWATPYSGQSKPIERAFRDLCDRVSKHPAFAGAYTGNKPDAKPENYGSHAVPFETFKTILDQEVARHNARPDRRSEVAFGRSFDDVFEESFKASPIRRATEEQKRLWLLGAQGVRAKDGNGEIRFMENRYWSEWMYRIAGQKVAARFDPDGLHDGLHIYDLDGSYIGHAACLEAGGFLNVEAAREVARKRGQYTRAVRDQSKSQREFTAAEIAARLQSARPDAAPDRPEAEIVRIATAHPRAPRPSTAALSTDDIEHRTALDAQVTRLRDRQASAEDTPVQPQDSFKRALELEEMIAEGRHPLTSAQANWLSDYQLSADYRGRARTHRIFGNRKD